jgi:hypothetical protein
MLRQTNILPFLSFTSIFYMCDILLFESNQSTITGVEEHYLRT